MKTLLRLLTLLLAVPLFAADAKVANVTLYQPDAALKERVGDVQPLGAYIQKLQAVCAPAWTSKESEELHIVVVLKPKGQSRVWFVSSLNPTIDRSKLKAAIEAISVPPVRGPIAFAVTYHLNGFTKPPLIAQALQPPIPAEWREKTKDVKGPMVIPDGFIPHVWPDSP